MKKFGQSFSKDNIKSFQRLLTRRVAPHQIVSPELASEMAEIALEVNKAVSCLIDRRGKVREYYIGELSTIGRIKAQAAREGSSKLAQLRLVVASPEDEVKKADLLFLKRYMLDLLLFINASKNSNFSSSKGGYLEFADSGQLCYLHHDPQKRWVIEEKKTIRAIANRDFDDLVLNIEEDLASSQLALEVKHKERAILVGISSSRQMIDDSFSELYGLTTTAGAEVCSQLTQNINKPDTKYFVGAGKIQEIKLLAEDKEADLVIFDAELTPSQKRNIEQAVGGKAKVIDRTELILDIFAQRARSEEGKLQVELAQLKYMAPRLVGKGIELSQLGGGIGTRGPGETRLETQRRHIKERINVLEKKVEQIGKTRSLQRRLRKQRQIPLVSIAGYTNAGKSTLFNALTNSNVLEEDKLFATLDPTIRELKDPKPFLLSDTVGFIQRLPTTLVNSFKATLEEIVESDLILLVLDISHPNRFEHLKVIEQIFDQLKVGDYPKVLVFNKVDVIPEDELEKLKRQFPEALFISARKKMGFETIINQIEERLFKGELN